MRLFSLSSRRIAIVAFFLSVSTFSFSQNSVSIGTTSTNPKAVLWLSGTNQGIIIPIVSNKTNVSAGPTEKGMVIFDDSDKKVYFFDGTAWNQVGGSGAAGSQGIAINGNTVQLNSTAGATFGLSNTAPTGKGQLLVWDGSKWDATIAPTTTGQTLSWDNTNGRWTLANASLTLAGDVSGPSNNTTIASTSGNNIVAALNNAATTSKVLPAQISAGTPNQVLTTSAGNVAVWANLPTASGTVTNIATGTGLTGGPITTTGTIALANTGVAAATYGSTTQIPQIAVDAQGRITNASNVTPPLAGIAATGFLSAADWNTFNNKLSTETDPTVKAINGIVKSNGTTISAATAGTDYQAPLVSGTNIKTINGASVLGAGNITAVTTETDPTVTAINGLVKSNGTTISAATAGTDYLAPNGNGSALTNLNASNLATGTVPTARIDVGTTANKIVQLDGTGKLPAVDGSQLTNLPAGTETDPTVKAINGLVKSNGTTISAATAGTDYLAPNGNGSALTNLNASSLATGTVPTARIDVGTTANKIVQLDATGKLPAVDGSQLTNLPAGTETDPTVKAINGLVKSNGTTISAATAGTDYQLPLLSGTNIKTINGASVLGAGNITAVTTETDPSVKAINGLVKSDGTTIGAVVSGTDIKTINGASILGAGNITAVTTETDPAVKAINGLVKSNGTTISAATPGTDYVATETDPAVKAINGLVKSNGTTISAAVPGTDYLTTNQNITLSGDITGSGTTAITTTVSKINGSTWPANASGSLTNDGSGNLTWVPAGGSGTVTSVGAGTGLTGGPITTSGTLSVDVGTTANKIVQLDGTGKLPAVDGSQLTNLPAGTETDPTVKAINGIVKSNGTTISAATAGTDYQAPLVSGTSIKTINGASVLGAGNITAVATETDPTVTAINGLVKSNGATISAATAGTDYLAPNGNGSALTNLNASNLASGTVPTARIDVGTTANKIVQLDGTGKLPAVDGSQLTNLPAGTETDPTVKAINGLVKSNGTTISAATAGTDYQAPLVSGTNIKTINGASVLGAGNITAVATETDPTVTAINGLVKSNGTTISAATAGTDYLAPNGNGSALTNLNASNISSGTVPTARIDVGTTANKIVQLDGTGKLPAVDGSQLTNLPTVAETDPTVKAINGLVKSNGTTISAATPGTDYVATETDPAVKAINGLVKSNGTTISAAVPGTDYLTTNQSITLSGDITGSGTTAISTTVSKINGSTWPANASGSLTNDGSGNLTWVPSGGSGTVTSVGAGTGLTGGPITTSGTLSVDVGTTANKIVQLDGTGKLPAVDGSQLTNLPAGTETDPTVKAINGIVKSNGTTISAATAGTDYQAPLVSGTNIKTINGASVLGAGNITAVTTETDPTVTAINGLVKSNGTTISAATAGTDYLAPNGNGSALTNLNASNLASGTVPTARIDVGTTANKIVQLDGTGKLPAVDGSQLTNLPTGTETDPTVTAINGLVKSDGSIISAATAGTDYLAPNGNGSALTNLNANNISSGTLAIANGGTGATTAPTARTALGLGTLSTLSAVTSSEITDGTIVDADINGSANINGAKINPTFGAQAVSTTSTLTTGSTGQFVVDATGNITKINNITTSFPASQGAANTVLTNDGAGNLSWAASSGWGLSGNATTVGNKLGTTNGNALTFITSNTDRMTIDATGNVGIGTTSPTAPLTISGTTSMIDVTNTGGGQNWRIVSDTDGTLKFVKTSGLTFPPLTLNGNGAIGIYDGVSAVTFGTAGQVLTSGGPGAVPTWSNASSGWGLTGNTGTDGGPINFIGTTDAKALLFKTNNADALRISPTGNVSMGTGIYDLARLEVSGGVGSQKISSLFTDGSNSTIVLAHPAPTLAAMGSLNGQEMQFGNFDAGYTTFTPTITMSSGGNVGIGTTSPAQKLSVQGGMNIDNGDAATGTISNGLTFGFGSSEGISSKRNPGGNQFGLDFYTQTVSRLSITNAGNVGIGTTNPLTPLQIGPTFGFLEAGGDDILTHGIYFDGSNFINRGTTANSAILLGNGKLGMYTFPAGAAAGVTSSPDMRFNVRPTGVGIQVDNPIETFQVNGATYLNPITAPSTTTDRLYNVGGNLFWNGINISSGGSGWSLAGNAGTNSSTDFIGTTDNTALRFKTNNNTSGLIDPLNSNVFFGYIAGQSTTGTQNVAIGTNAFMANTTGSGNVALGTGALQTNTSGTGNIAIGNFADVNSPGLINAVAIGRNAKVGASNSLILGGTGADAVNVGIGTTTPFTRLEVREDVDGPLAVAFTNNNTGTNAYAASRLVTDQGLHGIIFKNSSARSVDGGINTMTVRNDGGSLRLQSDFGNGIFVQGATGNVGIGTASPGSALEVAGQIKITGGTPGVGKVLTSDATGLATWQNAGGGGWGLTGTAGTVDGTNFIGTTDDIPVNIRVNGQKAGRIESNTGLSNLFLGYQAGNVNTASANTGIGTRALAANTTGNGLVAVGQGALSFNTTGLSNTAVGSGSLLNNTTGQDNTAVGRLALSGNSTAGGNSAFGSNSLTINSGSGNTAIGANSLSNNTTGVGNTAIGFDANVSVGNLTNATAIGYQASVNASNTIQLGNSGVTTVNIGTGTSTKLVAGQLQITGGTLSAGSVLTSDASGNATWQGGGWGLTGTAGTVDGTNFIGTTDNIPLSFRVNNLKAGRVDITAQNTFFGSQAGNSTTGSRNTAYGMGALFTNTTSIENTALGFNALFQNTAAENTAVGVSALGVSTTGAQNTAVGRSSLAGNTTGANNVALGYSSLLTNTTGSNNTAIGSGADVTIPGLTKATAIGYNAKVAASNTLILGGTGADAVNVGIGTSSPNGFGGRIVHLSGTGNTGYILEKTDATARKWAMVTGNTGEYIIQDMTGSVNAFSISPGGNVGIGTTTPGALLDVTGAANGIRVNAWLSAGSSVCGIGYVGTNLYRNASDNVWKFTNSNGTIGGTAINFADCSGTPNQISFVRALGPSTANANATVVESMRIDENGRVGIGTAAPAYPLDVSGGAATSITTTFFNTANGGGLSVNENQNPTISVRAFGGFLSQASGFGGGFYVTSDERIKRKIGVSDSQNDLSQIMKIKVTDYKMRDSLNAGNQVIKGLIAQEVEAVYPQAVTKQTNFIPNVYAMADRTEFDQAKQTLRVTMIKAHNLAVGDKVKLISSTGGEKPSVVASVDGNTFTVGNWTEKCEKVFVFGKEVNDFRIVDYDRLFTLNISATQELVKLVEEQKKVIDELKAKEEENKKKIALLEASLNKAATSENELASLKSEIEKIKAALGLTIDSALPKKEEKK